MANAATTTSNGNAAPTIDVAALIAAPEKREPAFRVSGRAVPFGDFALQVGIATKGNSRGSEHLVLTSGLSQQGFPQAAVALAILNDLIPRDLITALWKAADDAKQAGS